MNSVVCSLQLNIPGFDFGKEIEATNVLCLMNMVTPEELMDDEDYDGLFYYFSSSLIHFLLLLIVFTFLRETFDLI